MFNKENFSLIIRKIQNIYDSQEEFSKKSNIGRTSLSQYMNCRLEKPPKPDILKKLATASKGITTYDELMEICGYTNLKGLYNMSLSDTELIILNQMLLDYKDYLNKDNSLFDSFNEQKYLDGLSSNSKEKLIYAFRMNSLDLILSNTGNHSNNNDYFKFISEDDAMFPLLDTGDIALVYKQNEIDNILTPNKGTYLIKLSGKNTIRKIVLSEDKEYYSLVAMNACYKAITIPENELYSQIQIIGKVVKAENKSAFK